MRFCSLGSGSAGNATLVEAGPPGRPTRVLIDCGFSLRELELRLARCGVLPEELDAIFVTHEHGDHIGCAVALARRQRIPLWTSRGTWEALGRPEADGLEAFARDGQAVAIGALELMPYTVPHDAREPLQLRCSDGARRLGILTDAGSVTPHMATQLQRCEALIIECNHDAQMLAQSRYPASLKARIAGTHGHLSNDAAMDLASRCGHAGLHHVVAAHLSEGNNRPDLARAALAVGFGIGTTEVIVAEAATGFGWLSLA